MQEDFHNFRKDESEYFLVYNQCCNISVILTNWKYFKVNVWYSLKVFHIPTRKMIALVLGFRMPSLFINAHWWIKKFNWITNQALSFRLNEHDFDRWVRKTLMSYVLLIMKSNDRSHGTRIVILDSTTLYSLH